MPSGTGICLGDSVPEYVYVDIAAGTRKVIPNSDGLPKDSARRPAAAFVRPWSRWASFSTDSLSPDHQWIAGIRDGNVIIRPAGSDDGSHPASSVNSGPSVKNHSTINGGSAAIPFTTDGTLEKPYGQLAWSPDSIYVVGYHIDPVNDSAVYYVMSSISGTTRGQLHKHPYKQPGDPFTSYEMYIFPVTSLSAGSAAQQQPWANQGV